MLSSAITKKKMFHVQLAQKMNFYVRRIKGGAIKENKMHLPSLSQSCSSLISFDKCAQMVIKGDDCEIEKIFDHLSPFVLRDKCTGINPWRHTLLFCKASFEVEPIVHISAKLDGKLKRIAASFCFVLF